MKISNDKTISKQTFITRLAWALAVVLIMGPPGQANANANANTTTPPDGTFALYSESSGGWYFGAPILVFKDVNGTPQYAKTFHPAVIVSTDNKVVVTSIPTTTSTC